MSFTLLLLLSLNYAQSHESEPWAAGSLRVVAPCDGCDEVWEGRDTRRDVALRFEAVLPSAREGHGEGGLAGLVFCARLDGGEPSCQPLGEAARSSLLLGGVSPGLRQVVLSITDDDSVVATASARFWAGPRDGSGGYIFFSRPKSRQARKDLFEGIYRERFWAPEVAAGEEKGAEAGGEGAGGAGGGGGAEAIVDATAPLPTAAQAQAAQAPAPATTTLEAAAAAAAEAEGAYQAGGFDEKQHKTKTPRPHPSPARSLSGPGSSAGAGRNARSIVERVLAALRPAAMLDVPCGDVAWLGPDADLSGTRYIGADIASGALRGLKDRYPRRTFMELDLVGDDLYGAFKSSGEGVPPLVLCRHLMLHLEARDNLSVLRNIERSGAQWLLATTFLRADENHPAWGIREDHMGVGGRQGGQDGREGREGGRQGGRDDGRDGGREDGDRGGGRDGDMPRVLAEGHRVNLFRPPYVRGRALSTTCCVIGRERESDLV